MTGWNVGSGGLNCLNWNNKSLVIPKIFLSFLLLFVSTKFTLGKTFLVDVFV